MLSQTLVDINENNNILLDVRDLKKWFPVNSSLFQEKRLYVKAVDGVSFKVNKGETLGVVGESGCGKSTMGKSIIRLLKPTSGEVYFQGTNLTDIKDNHMKKLRQNIQIIFQDPYASLDPRMTVGDIIAEPLVLINKYSRYEIREMVENIMEYVGLESQFMKRYPHEFSGGQRQRIGIARAIILKPKLVICDEPVSALDVSVQAQILNLMKKLQRDFGITFVFISHDLNVVNHISKNVAVMYLGKIVEIAEKKELFRNPVHMYTKTLLDAIPIVGKKKSRTTQLYNDDMPSPINPPSGCRFNTRCSLARSICKEVEPQLKEVSTNHYCACHLI